MNLILVVMLCATALVGFVIVFDFIRSRQQIRRARNLSFELRTRPAKVIPDNEPVNNPVQTGTLKLQKIAAEVRELRTQRRSKSVVDLEQQLTIDFLSIYLDLDPHAFRAVILHDLDILVMGISVDWSKRFAQEPHKSHQENEPAD